MLICGGLLKVNNKKDGKLKIHLMTMIDLASCWFEVAPIVRGDPISYKYNCIFDKVWLARYPRPKSVGSDGGSDFTLHFNQLCDYFGIKNLTTGA